MQAELYDRCFELLEPVPLTQMDFPLMLPVAGTKTEIALYPEQQPTLPLTQQEKQLLRTTLLVPRFLYAPVGAGQRVGKIHCYIGEVPAFSTDLISANGAELTFVPKQKNKGFIRWLKYKLQIV